MKTLTPRAVVLVACFCVAAPARTGSAQVTVSFTSLEARIVTADIVLHGTVSKLSRKVIVAPDGKATQKSDVRIEYTMTIDVSETLKGEHRKLIELVSETSAYDERPQQWLEAKTDFLWFVTVKDFLPDDSPFKQDVSNWHIIRLGKPVPDDESYTSDAPPVFSMDFSVLKEPEDILACAREFIKKHAGALETHTFTIPHAVAGRCSPPGDGNFLTVPILPPLEKTARRMLASPEEFMPKDSELDSLSRWLLREAGVGALRYFKSDENIALLKGLLDDETEVFRTGPREGARAKTYPIRAAAHDVLTSWLDVPRPVTEVTLPDSGEEAADGAN